MRIKKWYKTSVRDLEYQPVKCVVLLVINSSVWLEVGLTHPHKIQEFVDGTEHHCRLTLVKVLHDFTNR